MVKQTGMLQARKEAPEKGLKVSLMRKVGISYNLQVLGSQRVKAEGSAYSMFLKLRVLGPFGYQQFQIFQIKLIQGKVIFEGLLNTMGSIQVYSPVSLCLLKYLRVSMTSCRASTGSAASTEGAGDQMCYRLGTSYSFQYL